jgi:hypothetical protein
MPNCFAPYIGKMGAKDGISMGDIFMGNRTVLQEIETMLWKEQSVALSTK